MLEAVLHRLIAPLDPDPTVVPLYVEPTDSRGSIDVRAIDRGSFEIAADTSVSFGTYFNAFPAAYWARWTDIATVRLTVVAEGTGTVDVYMSDASGRPTRIASQQTRADGPVVVDVPLDGMADGGWIWFDATAGDRPLVVQSGAFSAVTDGDHDARHSTTVAITTFNRPGYCLALLETLASRLDDLDCIDQIVVVDQGTEKVVDQSGFDAVTVLLAGRLRVIDQPNYGGSGGFARGMLEALESERSGYVLLLDDDIVVEPESVVRATVFADHCRQPSVVGGHMLSLSDRSTLHSFGEDVRMRDFWWGPASGVEPDHDFAMLSLRSTPWMHRRVDVGYNGWWMCLIPTHVLRRIGLSQPFFIKWDDAEYGLRAASAGIPTVTLPGAAVWHVPWTDKDDSLDWQAYFHQRNRVVAALLHSDRRRGGALLLQGALHQLAHLLAMHYSTATLRLRGLADAGKGPDHLHESLRAGIQSIREISAEYGEHRVLPASLDSELRRADMDTEGEPPPSSWRAGASVALGLVHQLRPVPREQIETARDVLPPSQARWWRLARLDSAVVPTRDGTEAFWYRRNRAVFWRLLGQSVKVYGATWWHWNSQRSLYRGSMPAATDEQRWVRTLRADRSHASGQVTAG